ncbi:MAG: MFS transporter, partial [Candidatus Thorarchaeota archaeon]
LNALMMPHLEGYIGITEVQFGIILSAGAAVGTLTAYILGTKKKIPYPLYLVSIAGLVAGISVIGLAFSTEFWSVLLSWALIGSVDVMLNIPLTTLMQDLVVDNYRGRVFALLNVVFTAVQVIGMAIGGVWAEAVVSTIAPLIGAAIGLVVVSVLGVLVVSKWDLHGKLDIMLNDSEIHVARDTESSEVALEAAT